jgi:hypothetical protein
MRSEEMMEHRGGILQAGGLQQKLEFTRIEPYPLTAGTIVKFNLVIFNHYHRVFAGWT